MASASGQPTPDALQLRKLLSHRPHAVPSASPAVIEAAAHVVIKVPNTSEVKQSAMMGELCRLFAFDQTQNGQLDPMRALRPDSVDYYLQQVRSVRTAGGLKSLREHLYRMGRTVQPRAYPPDRLKVARVKEMQPPYSDQEVQRLYRFALVTTPQLSRRLLLLLDVITGAGARPAELLALCGRDMVAAPQRPDVALVTLTNLNSGVIREVPVLDKNKSERLLAAAERTGNDRPLIDRTHKNVLNTVQVHVRKQQPGLSVSTVRLRHHWLVNLLNQPVPTALVHQLADLNDSHTLAGLRRWMHVYDTTETITQLEAAA